MKLFTYKILALIALACMALAIIPACGSSSDNNPFELADPTLSTVNMEFR